MVLRSLEDKLFFIRRLNPWHNFIYLGLVIVITMFTVNPVMVAISLISSLVYLIYLKGVEALTNIKWALAITVLTAIGNPLVSHYGETVLFYMNTNRITLEAFYRGLATGAVISAVIFWFAVAQTLYDSERFMAMFAKRTPKLSLLISMILRFIPELKKSFHEIHQAGSFLEKKDQSFLDRLSRSASEFSTLLSLSMEDSIDTANSMAARGYGSVKRNSIRETRWNVYSLISMLVTIALASFVIYGLASLKLRCLYYPYYLMPSNCVGFYVCFILLAILPLVLKIIGDIKWNLSMSRI